MITLHLHNDTHIALGNAYEWKETIKGLASFPDVQWNGQHWILHAGLLDKLLGVLGGQVTALPEFWLRYPVNVPAVTRKTKRQQQVDRAIELKHAQRWGAMVAKEMHK